LLIVLWTSYNAVPAINTGFDLYRMKQSPSSLLQKVHSLLIVLLSTFCFLCPVSCSLKKDQPQQTTKFDQYYIQGQILYTQHCSNCHQKNGRGLGLVYPPLDTSDYMVANRSEVICLIKNGKSGELVVNGKGYNQAMKGIPSLTDLEIAEISTYIYNTWSHQHGIIEVKEVSAVLATCAKK
jgi:cytochrome c551